MKQTNLFSILFTFILLILTSSLAAAAFSQEAGEIPYQINNSDHIVIGTVSNIEAQDNSTNNTITVDEWLYNPLPGNTIIVRTTSWAEDARFTKNESVLLMLNDKSPISISNDESPEKGVFYMDFGELGKHPISDRDAVIKELKAQGKWKGEDQTVNKTNETGMTANTGTVSKQEGESNTTPKSNSTPFISPIWVLAIVFGAVIYIKKIK
jgi:hypothetical protein